MKWFLVALTLALPGAAAAQYEAPANPADPIAQLAELIDLYDTVCLRAYPDEAAAARAAARFGGVALTREQVRTFLHDDPGIGWRIAGRTGPFYLTIEQSPPYRSCAVRVMTAAGFADLRPYQRLTENFEAGKGYTRINPLDRVQRGLRIVGGGERREDPDGSSESLLHAITSQTEEFRAEGNTAVEVRFIHQYYQAPRRPST